MSTAVVDAVVRGSDLLGRDEECRAVDALLAQIRDGLSAALVLIGDPGIGKTRLLQYAAGAADLRIVSTIGTESEAQLGYAALHRLLLPFLDRIDCLPEPQAGALRSAFGLAAGSPPDRFRIGLAVLTLLADVASEGPLLCLVDDVHWLDPESRDALAVVGRRLHADGIGLLLCSRPTEDLARVLSGLPTRQLAGLQPVHARQLLASTAVGRVDDQVADQLSTETDGNPLALIALAEQLSDEQLAGRRALPVPVPAGRRIDEHFERQIRGMPTRTRSVLLLATLAPPDDPVSLWRAAARLGNSPEDADPALAAGILRLDGGVVRFRHPLLRSAVHGDATPADRRRANAALADTTDPAHDPDRRSWHLAAAAVFPDAAVAAELVRSAERARSRGGYSAQAAFLVRAAELTPDDGARAEQFLGAARAFCSAGDTGTAQVLLDRSTVGRHGVVMRADAQRLRAQIELTFARTAVVPAILMEAVGPVWTVDPPLVRDMLMEALEAAMLTRQATIGTSLPAVARRALDAPPRGPGPPTTADLVLNAFARRIVEGSAVAVPGLRAALTAMLTADDVVHADRSLVVLGCLATDELWDDRGRRALLDRFESIGRNNGALNLLAVTILGLASCEQRSGRLDLAEQRHAEAAEMLSVVGRPAGGSVPQIELLAWQGREAEARAAAEQVMHTWSTTLGIGVLVDMTCLALAVLELGLGQYPAALEHARRLYDGDAPGHANRGLPELVEAGVRAGDRAAAEAALARLTERASLSGSPWALGVLARSRALLADDDHAEALYREAIQHLGTTSMAIETARAHLLLGEWLRRRKRRTEARTALRVAHAVFAETGTAAFAERARAELAATGERVPRRGTRISHQLTPQESQVARLAADGATNAEIACRLFVTPSTVEYHLNKIFRKLDLTSRRQLRHALSPGGVGQPDG